MLVGKIPKMAVVCVKEKAVVITASDSVHEGSRNNVSGDTLVKLLLDEGFDVVASDALPDERALLTRLMKSYAAQPDVRLIVTTGGTGLGPRDVTPEATRDVIDREIPGMAEAMRMKTLEKTPFAMTSRQVVGACGHTLIINFPGSPKAVAECFDIVRPVLHHVLQLLAGHTRHES